VTFGADPIQAVMGSLVLRTAAGDIVPAYGLLTVIDGARAIESPVAADGSFFLEQLSVGEHRATLLYHAEEFVVMLSPARGAAISNVGRVVVSEKKSRN